MARRLKLTPFARLLIFLVFAAPLAFIGASYYNGKDGLQEFKRLIGLDSQKTQVVEEPRSGNNDNTATPSSGGNSQGQDYNRLQERIDQLEKTNRDLKEKLDKKDQEIRYLKDKIKQLE